MRRAFPGRHGRRIVVTAVLAALAAALSLAPLRGDGGELLEPVPAPPLEDLEPAVREQLAEADAALAEQREIFEQVSAAVAESYGRLGMHYHAYGLLEAAAPAYRNARRLAPEDGRWRYYLGDLAQRAGDVEAARQHFEAILAGNPDDLAVRVQLGELEIAAGRLDDAERHLEHARALDPEQAATLAALAELALAREDAAAAVALLERALAITPAANRLHHPLGLAYRQLGDLERAREHLAARGAVGVTIADPRMRALEELVAGERILILRGRSAFGAGRFEEAAEAFRQAAEAAPESAGARVNLGAALGRAGDRAGAIAAFRSALELDGDNVTALFNLGQLLAGEDLEAAVGHLERAVALTPADGEIRRELADLLRRAGRAEEAQRQYELALAASPEDEDTHLGLAAVRVERGRFRDALDGLEAAHGVLPHAGRVAAALARMLAAVPDPSLRDGERALALADSVIAAAPTPEHAELLALAMAELGRCEEAARWQRQALAAMTEAPEARRRVAAQRLASYAAGPPCRPPIDG